MILLVFCEVQFMLIYCDWFRACGPRQTMNWAYCHPHPSRVTTSLAWLRPAHRQVSVVCQQPASGDCSFPPARCCCGHTRHPGGWTAFPTGKAFAPAATFLSFLLTVCSISNRLPLLITICPTSWALSGLWLFVTHYNFGGRRGFCGHFVFNGTPSHKVVRLFVLMCGNIGFDLFAVLATVRMNILENILSNVLVLLR